MSSLKEPPAFSVKRAWALHWPDYLIEGWALGMFMVSASVFTTLLEYPGAPPYRAVASDGLRLLLIGVAMGSTAVALIYSPWGKRSGAHMNPAVTLAFLSLDRISPVNAVFYILAQFLGGLLGVLASLALMGKPFAAPPINFIVTVPGDAGVAVAFGAELGISFALMLTILLVSNNVKLTRFTGLFAGVLIACYVRFEAPLSGMSMNPARTLSSAWPAGIYDALWIYFTAPIAGMWLAARAFHALTPWIERIHHAAKVVPTANDIVIEDRRAP